MATRPQDAERERLAQTAQGKADGGVSGPAWRSGSGGRFGENNSSNGDAWSSFPHKHARGRPYRGARMGSSRSATTRDSSVSLRRVSGPRGQRSSAKRVKDKVGVLAPPLARFRKRWRPRCRASSAPSGQRLQVKG